MLVTWAIKPNQLVVTILLYECTTAVELILQVNWVITKAEIYKRRKKVVRTNYLILIKMYILCISRQQYWLPLCYDQIYSMNIP